MCAEGVPIYSPTVVPAFGVELATTATVEDNKTGNGGVEQQATKPPTPGSPPKGSTRTPGKARPNKAKKGDETNRSQMRQDGQQHSNRNTEEDDGEEDDSEEDDSEMKSKNEDEDDIWHTQGWLILATHLNW